MEFTDEVNAALNAAKVHNINGVPVVIIPAGYESLSYEDTLPAPVRYNRTIKAQAVESFIDYANQHKNALGLSSAVFHDADNQRFTFVADNDVASVELSVAWGHHRAIYSPEQSSEFREWLRYDGKWLDQASLADFFEEREDDFLSPTGAEIYQLVTNLQLKRNVTVASAINKNDGTFSLQYTEEKGKGSIDLPETLQLGISPFKHGDRYEVEAKLRFRVKDGQVHFQIKLRNADRVNESAFKDIVTKIKDALPDVQHYTAAAW